MKMIKVSKKDKRLMMKTRIMKDTATILLREAEILFARAMEKEEAWWSVAYKKYNLNPAKEHLYRGGSAVIVTKNS